MIQARKDGSTPSKEQKTEDKLPGLTAQRPAATVRAVHTLNQQRATFVTSAVGGAPTAVILSDGSNIAEGGTLQYRRVSLGTQLQHVVTPVQVQGTVSSTTTSETPAANPRCTATSTQDLTHFLVAATTSSNSSLQNSAPFHTLGNITNVGGGQRIVLNSGGTAQDVYALRIAGSIPAQQIMVLDPASTDVTKVHSYSLASASLAGQKIVIGGGRAVKRQLQLTPPRALTATNSELVTHMGHVNRLLYGLVSSEGKVCSIPSSPKPKRIKLEKGVVRGDPVKRKQVLDLLNRKLQCLKTKYYQQQADTFYLNSDRQIKNLTYWVRHKDHELLEFLKNVRFDPSDDEFVISKILSTAHFQSLGHPLLLPAEPMKTPQSSPSFQSTSSSSAQRSVNSSAKRQLLATLKHSSKHNSISSVYDLQIGSQEEIVERAKQEAYVMQRVGDLRKEGLWSLKRLPKVAEAPRIKAHYDYLLEEMAWLATDFAQERKWKKAAAKKCARMITKYFQEKEIKAEKAEKEEQLRLRRIAGVMSREIKQFWNNIEKLAEYKQQTWLDEKRKKVLDTHLNFIVDQTEKYSSWLTQGMNRGTKDSPDSSRASTPLLSAPASPHKKQLESHELSDSDGESGVRTSKISSLQTSLNDSKSASGNDPIKSSKESLFKDKRKSSNADDSDFEVSEEEEDDEQTLLEQEKEEESVDHSAEIKELEEEGQMSIEELRAKYASFSSDVDMDSSEHMSVENDGEDSDSISEEEKSEEKNESLLKMLTNEELEEDHKANPSKEISDIAATAESFQPKGNTLSTTQVCTKVPFLLKHSLREYQHIGLDWLNAMYEKKLNGILADEMGLGKTIQTISVLAHLACEKGVWGPHLIVVPTSVMLNWEMELKKWCPAFKILTYYGTPKERKQKRVGWTKPNAFHVCITSYKLVVQDHQSFRRKRWKYFILDEAHHIKNFKSQRWQMLLNFQSSHRLLLTGTPLQNNLMELWSLMHFLMPNVFQSHREFKEWFVNPFTGMIEGSHEYNESLIKRLHKVLRPFLLRRLKCEVEKQLPKKYEHVVVCRLSKRQRYLYDDFMSQTKTKETLATGNFMSVINILMQLRKVCNHPNMFEERPTVSPFLMEGVKFYTASLAQKALGYNPDKHVNLFSLNLLIADLELSMTAFAAHRVRKFQVSRNLIEEIDSMPEPPPPIPSVKMKVNFCNSQASSTPSTPTAVTRVPPTVTRLPSNPVPNRLSATMTPQRYMVIPGQSITRTTSPAVVNQATEQYTLQLLQPGSAAVTLQLQSGTSASAAPSRMQCIQSLLGGIGRVVQTPVGAHFVIATSVASEQPAVTTVTQPLVLSSPAVLPQVPKVNNLNASSPILSNFNRPQNNNTATVSPLTTAHNRPVGRVAPFNGHPTTPPAEGTVNQNHVQSTRSPVVHSLSKPVVKPGPAPAKKNSLFYLEDVIIAREKARKRTLGALARVNYHRCRACPIYGRDLVEAVLLIQNLRHPKCSGWTGPGYVNCLNAITCKENPRLYWDCTSALSEMILAPEDRVCQLMNVINRFVFVVPAVTAPPIDLHISHPDPSSVNMEQTNNKRICEFLTPACAFLHPIVSNMKNQFPDLRLIQYDCGKLQRLAQLLWDLKKDHHRVLIFTQMTRMLDILEQFLNYHGHTYLRLDGNTKVEQRQALMERFNADKRIFCFILSTRSGGIGVNLTGADTVIFYDSDWNPTMDAQAQDRCHRIGQTRDVHIYRLISERTIEENILKKANQKRILGDLAIEGGNFNTAFFKKNTIHELFGIDTKAEIKKEEKKLIEEIPEKPSVNFSSTDLEQALGMAEEESDLQAAQTASAEAVAELAEFDESIPLDTDSRDNEEKSPAEEELEKLMEQLTPVEKYALSFLESLQEPVGLEQLKLAEEEIEAQKKDWELGHLKALKEEEERRSGHLGEDDSLFCSRDAANQVYFSVNGQEEMPIWAPPTPPTHENDIYMDCSMTFWYEPSFMHEARLPPVFIKKEAKRLKLDPIVSVTTTRKQKVRKEDVVNIPRSLFDRPSAAIIKMRREMKLQKVKGLMVGGLSKPTFSGLKTAPPLLLNKQPTLEVQQERPDWLVQEDWAILQVVQDLQGIPLNLTVLLPAQTPNWDLMSEGVHAITKNYRSAKSCRSRYENVIVPREEGKILYDTNPKKQKKTKGIYKTKNNRPMKTSQLYIQDNNAAFSKICADRFKAIMENAAKRKASERQSVTQTSKGTKVSSTLVENSINYDSPLTPMQIAANRAERIAREKQKNQPTAAQTLTAGATVPLQAVASQVTEQQIVTQRQVTTATTVAAATTNLITQQAVIASLAQQSQQLQQVQLSKANLSSGTVTSVSLAKSLTSGIMVNTPTISATATLANLTKALGQAGVTSISTQGAAQNAAIAAALSNASLRNQRGVAVTAAPTMTVQEMVAAATARSATSASGGTSTAPAVVSVANLTAVQLAASQRLTAGTATTVSAVNQLNTTSVTANQRNIAHLTAVRQGQLLRQRQEQQTLKTQQHMKRLQSVPQSQQQVTSAKLAISTAVTLATQPRVAMKQSVGRPMTEAEMTQLMKRQQLQQQQKQAQQVSITGGTLVKTVSAPLSGTSSLTIPVSAVTMGGVNINLSVPQGKAGAAKAATTITNQQIRQFHLQQQMLNQARKGNKVTANLTQLAKLPGKATGIPASMNAVQIVQHNPQGTQQVKGLPTAIAVQQIQQAMKQAIPQNLPVVVTATPSLPGVQQTSSTTLQPGSVKAQTTTMPSTTLTTTSGVLKGAPAVVVGQQATILQQVTTPVTLAVRAPQQVQIQVQQPPRLQLQDQPVVINSVASAMPTQASAANVVHAAIQAAKQQVAAAQQNQKASPYTMRLRNPPK